MMGNYNMYCKVENNKISRKPKNLKRLLPNVINPGNLSEAELNNLNVYIYEQPDHDPILESLGELYFDEINNTVTRYVIVKSFDIEAEKTKKISQIQNYIERLLSSTDKYFVRKEERGKPIPDYIQNERDFIHSECDRMKSEINLLTDIKTIIQYNIRINVQYHEEKEYI